MFNFAEKITNGRKGLQGFSSAFGLLKAQTKLHLVLLYSDALRQQSVLNYRGLPSCIKEYSVLLLKTGLIMTN